MSSFERTFVELRESIPIEGGGYEGSMTAVCKFPATAGHFQPRTTAVVAYIAGHEVLLISWVSFLANGLWPYYGAVFCP